MSCQYNEANIARYGYSLVAGKTYEAYTFLSSHFSDIRSPSVEILCEIRYEF